MKVYLSDGFDYIPIWNDNRKEKGEDQIKIHFKFLSGEDYTEIIDDKGEASRSKEWSKICDKVMNFQINDKDVTPEQIYSMPGLADLYVELKLAYKKETVIDKKK